MRKSLTLLFLCVTCAVSAQTNYQFPPKLSNEDWYSNNLLSVERFSTNIWKATSNKWETNIINLSKQGYTFGQITDTPYIQPKRYPYIFLINIYTTTNHYAAYWSGPPPVYVTNQNGEVSCPNCAYAVAYSYPARTEIRTNYVLGYFIGTNITELITCSK